VAEFSVNPTRIDPYGNFKFRLVWEDEGKRGPIAGVSKVSGLKRTTEVISHRNGGSPEVNLSPGSSKSEPITVERGITHDPAFESWATTVYSGTGDGGVSLKNFRKDIIIELYNLQGVKVRSWQVFRCWVSEFIAVPELDANANAIAFETIVLQNERFIRDVAVGEPVEF